tara:strand:+ start:1795 stop:2265 length:471 start_codon:yes stop_codon:yes gene_type:complete
MSEFIATSAESIIGPNSLVTLHFSLLMDSGEEIDTTRHRSPATFSVGDGSLLPGFERALFGLKAGDDAQISLMAEQAFGQRLDENLRTFPKNEFGDIEIELGLLVSFSSEHGELTGMIAGISDSFVEIDFNHPLAGQNVTFDVSIISVKRKPLGDS